MAEVYTLSPASQPQIQLVGLLEAIHHYAKEHNVAVTLESAQQALQQQGFCADQARALLSSFQVSTNYLTAPLDQEHDSIDEEDAAVTASRQAILPLLEVRLQQRIQRCDAYWRGCATCPSCQRSLESKGIRPRTRLSRLGEITLHRRWSVCPEHGGIAVADALLLLPNDDFTACLHAMLTQLSTVVPEGTAVTLFEELTQLDVSKHAAQKLTRQRGQCLLEHVQEQATHFRSLDEQGLQRQVERPPGTVDKAPSVVCIAIDGVLPMVRQELKRDPVEPGSRGGKGRHYQVQGREVKNAVLFKIDDAAQEMPSRGCLLDKTYVSWLGNWRDFHALLWVQLRRLRYDQAQRLLLLSDGAEWIRSLAEELPCQVELVLDLYHVAQRIWELSRALWAEQRQQKRWARRQIQRLKAGELDKVLKTLRLLESKCIKTGEAQMVKHLNELEGYLESNSDRMDYARLREQGLPISSAPVESANYHVTGARLKQQGMRWSEEGAAQMTVLRADLFNSNWKQRTRQLLQRSIPGASYFRGAA